MAIDSVSRHSVDKIASSTAHCPVSSPVDLSSYVIAQHGYVVAVRALDEKEQYDEVECTDGVFRHIEEGDVLVGTLGGRQALKGYSGSVPRHVEPGDTLHVLNLGGIIGECTSALPDLGPALPVEVLGAVTVERNGDPVHARIQDGSIPPADRLTSSAPLVMVSGTAMDTGKTMAACSIIEGLTARGLEVGAAKITGAALMRDVGRMREHGATAVSTFADAGVVCSTEEDMTPIAKGMIGNLNREADLDAIVVELGDGFIGLYGVGELLRDQELQQHTAAHVVTATDLAGAWAAERVFRERYQASIHAITGPVTDNDVGRRYVEQKFGISAVNACQDGHALAQHVADKVATEGREQTIPNDRASSRDRKPAAFAK